MKTIFKKSTLIIIFALLISCTLKTYSSAASIGTYENDASSSKWRCVRIFDISKTSITFTLQCNDGQTEKITADIKKKKIKFTCNGVKKKNTQIKGTLKLHSKKVILITKGNDPISTKGKKVTLKYINSDPMF